ncbi:WxL domain-containing protein [Vagococcus jeotgali]|uniref:WxL domain-containing protein n=1 Tax=Vagococcus jeotgali TaxID=3109030 RepID=UPI002DDC7A12|nr:WxL domain-containing protein [Vagococcus sp. B2T-5]
MKKQILGFALVATSVLALGINANAATEATSEVGVGFQEDSNTTDPTEPGEARGRLSLKGVPTAFQFGNKHKITTNGTMAFPVVNTGATDARELNVYDDRPSEVKTGWVLSGELSDLVATNDPTKTLNGALDFRMNQLMAYKASLPQGATASTPLEFPENPYTDTNSKIVTTAVAPGIDFIKANADGRSESVELEMGGDPVNLFGIQGGDNVYKGGIVTQLTDIDLVVKGGAEAQTDYTGEVTWKLSEAYTGSTTTP